MTRGGVAASPAVRLEAKGELRVLTLDRPPLNVMDIALLEELRSVLDSVGRDPNASVLLITGQGKAFSAGVDVADHTSDRVHRMIEALHGALSALRALRMPVIAAVNGAALGGGLEIALACDVVLARAGAKLGQPEIRLGVFPPFAAVALPRLVGPARALDLCLTGRIVSAEEAEHLGLVQHVYAEADFRSAAEAYALDLAGLSRPVLRLAKRAIREGLGPPLDDALEAAERLYVDDLMSLEDPHEGLRAFVEKRPPAWKGG